jgi:hypothetical protein
MCDRCNPLGLEQPASSQVHGTVFVALMLAIVVLAVAARAAISGVGPFQANVVQVLPVADGLAVTISVRNEGSKQGATVCHLTSTPSRGVGAAEIVQSPQIGPGQVLEFTTTTDEFGRDATQLSVECSAP